MILLMHLVLAALTFVLGTVVGSFLNVCIYRIPWQKSVIWPSSRCPRCLEPIESRDNIPVLSWIALGKKCRHCALPIAARYPLVETLVGALFLGVYLVDVAHSASLLYAPPLSAFATMAYHLALIALLVVASFIDLDLWQIPDPVTYTGMILGLLGGTIAPGIRPDPARASSWLGGLGVGLLGLVVGALLVWLVRFLGTHVFRREAMGLGDVTLLGMIGAFMGWQAAVLTFFLAPFLGLAPALAKVIVNIGKWLTGRKLKSSDREIPYGPYLSLAATLLVLGWPWIWNGVSKRYFEEYAEVFWFFVGS
ncbi:MAG TPA: prepilin peptidase [Isosphaeraceae bacterium]|nr:prepilin peptidase [Isosphaeraceae bacterium]